MVKGHKIGLTSKAMREYRGLRAGLRDVVRRLVHPRGRRRAAQPDEPALVEAELAFVLRAPLVGPGVNAVDVIRATDFVLPCLEVVDVRQKSRGPNSLVDSISDAAACGRVVLGGCPPG